MAKSARSLILEHTALQIKRAAGAEATDPGELPPGFMQLYSYYKPGLEAGRYSIDALQTISANGQQKTVTNYFSNPVPTSLEEATKRAPPLPPFPGVPPGCTKGVQAFEVVAPQFTLPADAVHSYYPPDGHQDEGRVLPHIVFDDPHLPWERPAGSLDSLVSDPTGTTPTAGRSTLFGDLDKVATLDPDGRPLFRQQIPWMAVVVFDPSELALTPTELKVLSQKGALATPNADEIKREDSTVTVNTAAAKVPITGAYPMAVSDYLNLPPANRVHYEEGGTFEFNALQKSTESMKAIFPTQALTKSLFGDLSKHKYLAHVRNINTTGMPDAGVQDDGLYSIVISHRTAAYDLTQPKTQIAHLVSIEFMDSTTNLAGFASDPTSRVGLVSLYSWTYVALPPNPVNFVDSMINLGNTKQYLNPPGIPAQSSKPTAGSSWSTIRKPLLQRLQNGYVFARYRAQTGEETVCLNRGPLVPVTIPPHADTWPGNSNFSTDYQILDKELGLVDISYSSAFQLGKTMAIADRVFCQALMRVRAIVYSKAASDTFKTVTNQPSKQELATNINSHVNKLANLSLSSPVAPVKWSPSPPPQIAPNFSLNHPDTRPILRQNMIKHVLVQASASDGTIYNEFNLANNTDWTVVLSWVLDKLFLASIPAHHLIVDPSHLPMESMRLFHIDDTWLDCLIDGALSVANHLDQGDDQGRRHVKMGINEYLKANVPPLNAFPPQIPCYGILIRSAVVKAFPDLKISIQYNNDKSAPDAQTTDDGRARICRLTNIDETTLLCLLDRKPEEIEEIQFSQPHHQQRYSLGNYLNASTLEFEPRQLYTNKSAIPPQPSPGEVPTGWPTLAKKTYTNPSHPNDPSPIYNWDTRCVQVDSLAKQLQQTLSADANLYNDSVITSVVMGLELNDPSYYLLMTRPPNPSVKVKGPRVIWTGTEPPADASPRNPTNPRKRVAKLASGGGNTHVLIHSASGGPNATIPRAPSRMTNVSAVVQNVISGRNIPGLALGGPSAHFLVAVYPDYATKFPAPSDPNFSIATGNLYLMDLIVSIRRDSPADPKINDQLREITVNIPINGKGQTDEPLLENYSGPGATMLSNQRYVVALNLSATNLQCRVIPRGKDFQAIDDSKTDELSFTLSECYISKILKPTNRLPPHGSGPAIKGIGVCNVGHIEVYQVGNRVVFGTEQKHEVYKANRQDFDPATGDPL